MSPRTVAVNAIKSPLGLILTTCSLLAAIGWAVDVEPKSVKVLRIENQAAHDSLRHVDDSLRHAISDVDLLIRAECIKAVQPLVKAALKCDAHSR